MVEPTSPFPVERTAEPAAAEELLVRTAELLHAYGTPAHRLERLLARVAAHLAVRAQFLSTPTSLGLAFGAGGEQRVRLLRVEPGKVDLGKLIEFDEVLEGLEDGAYGVAEAGARIERLAAAPPRHGPLAAALAIGGASGGAAVLFGGGGAEALSCRDRSATERWTCFLARDALAGMEAAFQVAIVATSLVGGLLAANALLPPRRAL